MKNDAVDMDVDVDQVVPLAAEHWLVSTVLVDCPAGHVVRSIVDFVLFDDGSIRLAGSADDARVDGDFCVDRTGPDPAQQVTPFLPGFPWLCKGLQ